MHVATYVARILHIPKALLSATHSCGFLETLPVHMNVQVKHVNNVETSLVLLGLHP